MLNHDNTKTSANINMTLDYITKYDQILVDILLYLKLDGVGPADNRPPIDQLGHLKKNYTSHVTPYTSHETCDIWWGVTIL